MHELSIIQSILDSTVAAVQERGGNDAVESVEIQVGELAGIELSTLEFLWPAAVGDTLLAGSALQIERIPGKASCSDCATAFAIRHFFEPCPSCGSHFLNIIQGEELRIKSITLADKPVHATEPLNWN
jgi:hydrogenase nickel incorporation protein HypA/HybF